MYWGRQRGESLEIGALFQQHSRTWGKKPSNSREAPAGRVGFEEVSIMSRLEVGEGRYPADPDALSLFLCPQVLEYNAVGGKYQQVLTVLIAFQELVDPRKQDAASLQ